LDSNGKKVGVPIKASLLNCKPTLNDLEKKFTVNEAAKEPLKQQTKNTIDTCLLKSQQSIAALVANLLQQQIYTVLRQNTEGRLYGITFVDNRTKTVFNGSDLGKGYSANKRQITAIQPNKVSAPIFMQ
jgi:hypothetical protein